VNWELVFLGLIAFATLAMALVQVGAIVAALRVARQAQAAIESVQHEVRPLIARANVVVDEAARTAALATAQVQKVDRLLTDLSQRMEETAAVVQDAIVKPAREGFAIVAAIRAMLSAFRSVDRLRARHGRGAEEEDPLFIG
jgi:ElaB/YqjD/DUF883 family membrane-anchored ribosome-binding protein